MGPDLPIGHRIRRIPGILAEADNVAAKLRDIGTRKRHHVAVAAADAKRLRMREAERMAQFVNRSEGHVIAAAAVQPHGRAERKALGTDRGNARNDVNRAVEPGRIDARCLQLPADIGSDMQ